MATEIHQIRSSAVQTMVDNYHQSGSKSWEQWVNNSPLNNIRQNHPDTFDELENSQSQFTENISAPLSQYLLSSHNVFRGSANDLIKQILAVYKQVKLEKIAPNVLVQIDMRSQHDIFAREFNRSNDEELVYELDDDDDEEGNAEYECKYHSNSEQHSVSITSKREMIDVVLEEKVDEIMRQCAMPLDDDDGHDYKRYEVLLYGTDITLFKAVSNNNIPDSAFENAPLCMIFNSTASVGQILNKFCTETAGLITVSFHVYQGSVSVYFYVTYGKGQSFGSRIFADDLISMIPLLFEDSTVDEVIKDELKNYLQFKPDAVNQDETKENDEVFQEELDPLFASKLDEIVNAWNTGGNKKDIINGVKQCFIEHKINYYYFQDHKRKDFVRLLRKYKIKVSAASKLWKVFSDEAFNEQYISQRLRTLVGKYSRGYFDGDLPQDIVSLTIFYYGIIEEHLDMINWSNLKLITSPLRNNDSIHLSVTITQNLMKKYCSIALERLNRSIKNDDNIYLIPISVDGKHDDYELVLIVRIVHKQCIGISFKYDSKSNIFVATTLYLDAAEIESRHKSTGLKSDDCKQVQLKSFNLRQIKFIEDRDMSLDDDNDDGNYDRIDSSLKLPPNW